MDDLSERLSEIARNERQRLEGGGYIRPFDELQRTARLLADNNVDLEIKAFHLLESINDEYEHWKLFVKNKEEVLGRRLTAEEIRLAHTKQTLEENLESQEIGTKMKYKDWYNAHGIDIDRIFKKV